MTATLPLRYVSTGMTAGIVPVDMDHQMEFVMVWLFHRDYQNLGSASLLNILKYFETSFSSN